MKTLLISLISFLWLTDIQTTPPQNSQESFEGVINYKIIFVPKSDNQKYIDYQRQKYGDRITLYIGKDGRFRRDYINSGKRGFDFFLYDPVSNNYFTKWRNIDTIYASNANLNSLQLTEEKDLEKVMIMKQECNGYFISGSNKNGNQNVALSYYFPKDKEYINPEPYNNYNDFFFNKVSSKMKAPFYKLVMDMQYYSVTFEIENIVKTKLDSQIFILPKNFPYKDH